MVDEERPVQEWIPRARVAVTIRFEEFGSTISATPPKTRQPLRKGKGNTAELEYVPDPEAPEGVIRYVLRPKSGSTISAASADKFTHSVGGIIPKSATHTRNGLDKADTLSAEVAFLDLPFDPCCIRSCGVEYYLGTITAGQLLSEQHGTTVFLPDFAENGRSNRRMTGWVDQWDVDYVDGTPVVRLECRDQRCVLIDQDAPPQLHLDPTLPLDKAIAKYLTEFPQFAGIGVEWRGNSGEDAPKLSGIVVQKGQIKGTQTGKDKSSVMDYLVDMVGAAGCILTMDGLVLVVARPRTLLAGSAIRSTDPFNAATRSINGMPLKNRAFVWGHDLKEMKFGRKFNAKAPTNLEVRCYVGSSKKTIIARFPDVTTVAMPGAAADKKWLVWRVRGVSSPDTLKVIAQQVHEQINRGELSVNLTTNDLASFGGDNLDPDVLDMLPGDAFEVYVLREHEGHTTAGKVEDMALGKSEMVEFIVNLGHERDLAEAYASSYVSGGFQMVYRLRSLKTSWSIDGGVNISAEGSNFVEVRLDKDL